METTSAYYNETLYLLTAKVKVRVEICICMHGDCKYFYVLLEPTYFRFFRVHMYSFFRWAVLKHPISPPPPSLIRPAGLRNEFHLFCISQGFPASALIPIITCKLFEISAENKTGLISEICPRLNSVKIFTKITEFGKSATKITCILCLGSRSCWGIF